MTMTESPEQDILAETARLVHLLKLVTELTERTLTAGVKADKGELERAILEAIAALDEDSSD